MADAVYTIASAAFDLAPRLIERGWTLHGYAPETGRWWPAVASMRRFVLGFGIGPVEARRSGQQHHEWEFVHAGDCTVCAGTGVHPVMGKWTRELVDREPVAYAKAALEYRHGRPAGSAYEKEGGVGVLTEGGEEILDMFVLAPSRLPFREDGRYKCVRCDGAGRTMAQRAVRSEEWPTFATTPPTRTWHVEKDGIILACGSFKPLAIRHRPEFVLDQIAAVTNRGIARPKTSYVGLEARVEEDQAKHLLRVHMPMGGAFDLRLLLTAAGFRWWRGAWVYRSNSEPLSGPLRLALDVVAEFNRRAVSVANLTVLGGPAGGGSIGRGAESHHADEPEKPVAADR